MNDSSLIQPILHVLQSIWMFILRCGVIGVTMKGFWGKSRFLIITASHRYNYHYLCAIDIEFYISNEIRLLFCLTKMPTNYKPVAGASRMQYIQNNIHVALSPWLRACLSNRQPRYAKFLTQPWTISDLAGHHRNMASQGGRRCYFMRVGDCSCIVTLAVWLRLQYRQVVRICSVMLETLGA